MSRRDPHGRSRREFMRTVGTWAVPAMMPALSGPVHGVFNQAAAGRDRANVVVTFADVTAAAGLLQARNVSGSRDDKQFLLEEMGGGAASSTTTTTAGWTSSWSMARSFDPKVRDSGLPVICSTTIGMARSPTSPKKAGLTHSGWGQGVLRR